ncbi:MAG: TonB-dependent receptor [Limnohabitans sp.]
MLARLLPFFVLSSSIWCVCPGLGHELAPVEVVGHYDNAPGTSEAASQGAIGAELLQGQALLRPAEVLEHIAGMVVTQHSGDGKANQYFLRGMNLDHGTDFATTLDGVPINLPTHAHGQGYSDLNLLIPELVRRIDYRKGPYCACDGDFSSAGSAHIIYRTRLERPLAEFTVGQHGHLRALVADSREVGEGVTLLSAFERLHHDGPWTVAQDLRKSNAQFVLSGGSAREGWRAGLSAYAARWNATDQVPQRLIDAGAYQGQPFGRFDSLDPTDGAHTQRNSLSASWHQATDRTVTRVQAYAIGYDLQLYSNFTYSLQRASDQFAQTDHRTVLGGQVTRSWLAELGEGRSLQNTLGLQLRQDRIRVGLLDTVARQTMATVRDDGVVQSLLGVYAENEMDWRPWLRTVLGLRTDQFNAQVDSHTQLQNSGTARGARLSPKFSLILGPWQQTEWFMNAGRGFHSNDARGATARVDPRTGLPVEAVPALVGSRGQEVGLKSRIVPNLQTTLALWRLDFDSELVYVGDAGSTQAGRPSRRAGLEWSSHWTPGEHLWLDASLAWTRPRYADPGPAPYIANAVQKVANLRIALRQLGPWSAALGWRYVGAAPLTEDNTVRSAPSMTANLRVGHQWSPDLDWSLDVFNLTNRQNGDIAYVYASRLAGEPSGVQDLHLHPAEPRSVRLTARLRF